MPSKHDKPADIEPGDKLTSVLLCGRCMAGEGGECHTPGCALWLNRAPDIPVTANDSEPDTETGIERKAIEVLARGEWPDSPTHGVWRAGCMVRWLKDAGIALVPADPS